MRFDIHIHSDETEVLRLLNHIIQNQKKIMTDLTVLEQEVSESATAQESAIVLLKDLTARIIAAGTDPVKLKALTDAMSANTDALAAAVVENTPSE